MKPESRIRLRTIFALGMSMLLAACAASAPPPPPVVAAELAPKIVQPLPQEPSVTDELLSYQQSLFMMKREDLQRELAGLPEQAAFPRAMLQRAMVLATLRGPGDLARAQQSVEQVLRSNDGEARAVRPLAQLLAANYADLRRQTEQAERLAQQAREQQRRIDQLDHMLEGLKAIERNLALRPGPAAPAK